MNKEKAINILLKHAIRSTDSSDDAYAPDDSLTTAILFLENDRNKNKKDVTVEITGLQLNSHKGA